MVEYTVEIGIGDLYGATTEGPHLDCAIVMETIEGAGVTPPPTPSVLYETYPGEGERADPPNDSAYQALRASCQAVLASGARS
ncbi:hypothetical protein ACFL6C_14120 [Myxococcota bacterium]